MTKPAIQILIVYDNYTLKRSLTPDWGFSCLITLPQHQILFDTGADPSILLSNIRELDVDLQGIDAVVLSHGHGDHVGGLSGILEKRGNLSVYLPASFKESFKAALREMGTTVVDIRGLQEIFPGVHTTGELGAGIMEQSLILNTSGGLVIITGCAHPGIVQIVEHAAAAFKKEVVLLIGGFHLIGYSPEELKKIALQLDRLNVKKIAPCHCSGDEARDFFKAYYKDRYIACAAGLLVSLPDLEE